MRSRTTLSVIGLSLLLVTISFVLTNFLAKNAGRLQDRADPDKFLKVRLDNHGPYLILATVRAARSYSDAIATAKMLHPEATYATFDPGKLESARQALLNAQPRYALIFIEPQELDVNFAWSWLTLTSSLDDDPFVDTRTGYITGRDPDAAAAFIERISSVVKGKTELLASMVDNMGPGEGSPPDSFVRSPGSFMLSPLGRRWISRTITHGKKGFSNQHLNSLAQCGFLHFGGHGHPDRVDDGITAEQVKLLPLSTSIAFNGACYTGVTGRWYDLWTPSGTIAVHTVAPENSFALQLLGNKVIAYFAAVHPDHGIPVYQEMEYLAYNGGTLGGVIKHTYDGVVIGNGGKRFPFKLLSANQKSPRSSPAELMLSGTAARVLFGDPSMIVTDAIVGPPFDTRLEETPRSLKVVATLSDPELKCSLTDTYYSDLSRIPNMYNDRALVEIPVPKNWEGECNVEVVDVKAHGKPLKHRLVGQAIENDSGKRLLHIQVDVESDGFMKSAFRNRGSKVELQVQPVQ